MAQVTVYFDDSGTHPEANTAIAACYVSTVDKWKNFESDWRAILKEEKFASFHMADFAASKASKNEFSGWDDDKRRRVLRKLCATINIRIRTGFVAAVKKRDYDDLITGDFRKYCGEHHYTFALRTCANGLGQWRRRFEPSATMHYVFDQMTKGHGKSEIIRVMDAARDESKRESLGSGVIVLGGYTFEDKKKFPPLQASDILAWCGFQVSQHLTVGRPFSWIAKEALRILQTAPLKQHIYDKDGLGRWANAEKEELKRRGQPKP